MNESIERTEEGIDSLRNRMDADARFRRSLSGYDPQDVRAYVENVKRIFAQQSRAAKQEQEDLIVKQMTEDLPDDPIERAKALNMAQMTAREVSMSDMGEFLSNL